MCVVKKSRKETQTSNPPPWLPVIHFTPRIHTNHRQNIKHDTAKLVSNSVSRIAQYRLSTHAREYAEGGVALLPPLSRATTNSNNSTTTYMEKCNNFSQRRINNPFVYLRCTRAPLSLQGSLSVVLQN